MLLPFPVVASTTWSRTLLEELLLMFDNKYISNARQEKSKVLATVETCGIYTLIVKSLVLTNHEDLVTFQGNATSGYK
jgi:hypothetical protein